MALLLIVSLVWAFSFGLIKGRLTGLDPEAVAVVRLGFATLVLLPTFRPQQLPAMRALEWAGIGAVQFGLMYVCYLRAFATLPAHQVALFTVFTPLYVAAIDGLLQQRFVPRHAVAALLAIAGAAIILWPGGATKMSIGFLWVQASNLCFAVGQVVYRRRRGVVNTPDAAAFAWLYLGAMVVTGLLSLANTEWNQFRPTSAQWLTLGYLGVIASGLAFFGWNVGAARVNAGTLAVMNNLKIPLAVAVSLLVFGEQADLPRLIASLALLATAVVVAERAGRG